jgi:hypothetical protein
MRFAYLRGAQAILADLEAFGDRAQ